MSINTYYKKKGRKYIPVEYWEPEGYPEGLWLLYKSPGSNTAMQLLHYAKVYDITNLGKWADLWVNFGDKLTAKIGKAIEEFIEKEGRYSIQDLSSIVLKVIADDEI